MTPRPIEGKGRNRARMAWTALVSLALGVLCFAPGIALPAAATPWSGGPPTPTNLLFFLHNSSNGVAVGAAHYLDILSTVNDSRAPWSGTGAVTVGEHYDSVAFVMAPQLAGALTLNGTVGANLYLNESGSAPSGGSITLTVYSLSASGTLTLLGAGPANSAGSLGPGGSTAKSVALTGPTLHRTVPAADSIEVNITVSGNTAESYGIWWGAVAGTTYVSTVAIPASTYLVVPVVSILPANGTPTTVLPPTKGNATVTVDAVVSDPLGAYDFESFPVEFTVVERATGTVVYGPVPMTAAPAPAPPGALNGTYRTAFNYSSLVPGSYNFTVTSIDDTNVNLGGEATLPAYYGREAIGVASVTVGLPPVPIRVATVDDHDLPLRGAVVQVRSAGTLLAQNTTNATGYAGFDLSRATEFTFSVVWQGVPVGTQSAYVTGPGQEIVLRAAVGYPVFEFVTGSHAPLAYALVSIVHPNGSVLPSRVTNASGELTLVQAPAGNYSVSVIYEDAEVVWAQSVTVSGDGPFVLTVGNVFTLTVTTTDSGGGGLSQVFVQVVNSTTGATVASGVTGGSGSLEFLVPAGRYLVTGSWSATYALTSLSETEKVNVTVRAPGAAANLNFSKAYPAFTSTNEFFLLVGYGVLAVFVVLLGLLLLRRRRAGPPPSAARSAVAAEPAPAPAPSDPGATDGGRRAASP